MFCIILLYIKALVKTYYNIVLGCFMHVTFVISSLESGGAERVITGLANHYADQGHRVSLVTMAAPHVKPFYQLDARIDLIQLNIMHLTKQPMLKQFLHRLKLTLKLRSTFKKLKPDLIVSFIDLMNLITLVSSAFLKIPIVVSERIDPRFREIPQVYKWLRLKLYPYAQSLVVQTQCVADYFPLSLQSIISIIPNVIPLPPCNPVQVNQEVFNIVCVGRLDPQKNHVVLIRAFSEVIKQYPEVTLTIYGKGDYQSHLEALITDLHLKNHVFLPGTVSDIFQKLKKADLFVFPSLYEGFPNALCEAMTMGLPIIASNCSGNIDVIHDNINGRLFDPHDCQRLSKLICELILDYPQRQRLGEAAQWITKDYGADKIYKLWRETLSKACR